MIKIMGVLFLLLAALIVGSFMMVLADINGVMVSDQVPRDTLSISTRIALSVFQDDSMAASDEIDFVQMISLAQSTFLLYGVAALVCAGYGIFLLLSGQKHRNGESGS
ncbi:MAG TPA: hypothetical protein EYQ08_09435 [Planctomycetes bacterium]|nr:hypothetical protein [Planctomycetota bacterium]HIK82151.1 hypothetical protein [Planctomycetota bacterium]